MPDYSAGTASVRVGPSTFNFVRELRSKLSAIPDPGFVVAVSADTGQARADIERFRALQARNGIRLPVAVDVDTTDFRQKVERARQESSRPVETQLDIDLRQAQDRLRALRIQEEARKLQVSVEVDADPSRAEQQLKILRARSEARDIEIGVKTGRAQRQVSELGRSLDNLRRSDILRLNIGAAGIAALPAAAAGLAEVAQGLQQVAQAGIAVPGVIAGALASIGTLAIGLSGISDAYSAISDAAESSGKDQAAQAAAARQASNGLRNSLVDEAQAREDVARATRDARNELIDLRIEQRGGMLDESRAILEAQKAREDLARGDFTDIRDAALRVQEADQRLLETRERNRQSAERLTDANAKGVAGSDQVTAANERLTRAQQQLADAQAAVADTGTAVSAAQDKAQQAMDKLGPNAQDVVRAFVDLKPAFNDFRTDLSQPLLEGKGQELRDFFAGILPNLSAGGAGIAAALNDNVSALLGSVSDQDGRGLIDRILGNTGDAQARLTAAMDPLVKGIGTLTAAGTDALPRMADGFTSVMERFRDFVTEADQDGRLDKWINSGLDGLTNLGNIAINLGKAFTGITGATSGNFLEWLREVTDSMQQWINSANGQNRIANYFAEGRQLLGEFLPLIRELPGVFQAVGDGASTYIGGLLPILTTLSDLIGDHPELVGAMVAAYLTMKTVGPVVDGVRSSLTLLSTGVTAVGTGFYETRTKARDAMAGVDDTFRKSGNDGSPLGKFSSRVAGFAAAAGPLGLMVALSTPLLVQFADAFTTNMRQAEEATKAVETAQKDLEATVDRVTGKLTDQSLDRLVSDAQNIDTTGQPGGGIPGISNGNAVTAAETLGIAPDVYARALAGDPDAVAQVRDTVLNNNLRPEFAANTELAQTAQSIETLTDGAINQEDLLGALINNPGALAEYDKQIAAAKDRASAAGNDALVDRIDRNTDLASIAQRLSATGQAGVLSAGWLNRTVGQVLPGVGADTRQQNQARNGRARVGQGGGLFPVGTEVDVADDGYKVTVPEQLAGSAIAQGVPVLRNPDGTFTFTLPTDTPWIEKYKQGGPTPGPRDRGFLAELHGEEWVHDADTVKRYGRQVMDAMWKGEIDPAALRGLIPGFVAGGPGDGRLVDERGNLLPGTGISPGPVAPNPLTGVASAPGALQNLGSSVMGALGLPALSGAGGQPTTAGVTGGGWGPGGPPAGLGGGPDGFDIRRFGIGPGPAGSGPADWANFAGKTVGDFAGKAIGALGQGLLGAFGLQGVLNSPYFAGATGLLGHFLNPGGDGQSASTGAATPVGTPIDPTALTSIYAGTGVAPPGMAPFAAGDPYGLDAGSAVSYGGQGFPSWVYALADQYGVEASTYAGHQEGSGQNRGIDWRPRGLDPLSAEGAAVMEKFAAALQSAPGVEQIIFQNAATGARVGRDPGDRGADQSIDHYYRDDWAGHQDHVHTRFATGTVLGGQTPGSVVTPQMLAQLYTGPGASPASFGAGAAEQWRPAVRQALATYGAQYGITNVQAWEDAMVRQIESESGGNPGADNPNDTNGRGGTQHVRGLLQFLDSTYSANNITGRPAGDPIGQIAALIPYVTGKYGMNPDGSPKQIGQGVGYRTGGPTPASAGPLPDGGYPAVIHPKEFMISERGRSRVPDSFLHALNQGLIDPAELPGLALGGDYFDAVRRQAAAKSAPPAPRRPVDGPLTRPMAPQRPNAPAAEPVASPTPPPPAPAPVPPPAAPAALPPPPQPPAGPTTGLPGPVMSGPIAPPNGTDYNMPWVSQAIESTAATVGNAAAAAATMGAGGLGGGAGGLIQGAFGQAGKIIDGVANIISGAMVGSVPGSFTTTPEVYGRTLRPEQQMPQTALAAGGGASYGPFFGHDTNSVMQEINLHESINQQSALASHPTRV